MIKIADLRKELVEVHGYTNEAVNIMKKNDLMKELEQARQMSIDFDTVITDSPLQYDSDSSHSEVNDIPRFGNLEWSNFLLSQLTEDEKIDGYPKLDGLRRLVEEFVGNIDRSRTKVIHSDMNGMVILHEIEIENIQTGKQERYSRIGESNELNTSGVFRKFPFACAESKAIGRALRSILRVNTLAYEEVAGGDSSAFPKEVTDAIDFESPATSTQLQFIDTMCKPPRGINCNVEALIKYRLPDVKSVSHLTREQAAELQEVLSDYQRDSSIMPSDVVGYIEGWQK